MSNYQHNINGPHFPAGAHVAHYSLANTTLIGQEVQHRLWEKHWGEQFPAPPPLYMWCQPGICLHSYPYGLPPTFRPVYAQTGSDQSEHPVLLPTPRQEKSSDAPDKTFTAKSDNSLVGTLQKTKTLTRNTTTTSKLTQVFNSVGHKVSVPILSMFHVFLQVISGEFFSWHVPCYHEQESDQFTRMVIWLSLWNFTLKITSCFAWDTCSSQFNHSSPSGFSLCLIVSIIQIYFGQREEKWYLSSNTIMTPARTEPLTSWCQPWFQVTRCLLARVQFPCCHF